MDDMRRSFVERALVIVQDQDRMTAELNGFVQSMSEQLQIVATELRTEIGLRDKADAKLSSRLGADIASNQSRVDELTKVLQEAIAKDSEDMSALYELVQEALENSRVAKEETDLVSQQQEKDRGLQA